MNAPQTQTALVYLQMPDAPALSIQQECFTELITHHPHINWIFCLNDSEFSHHLPNAHYVLCWRLTPEMYALAPNLKAVFTPAAGKDWIAPDPLDKIPVYHGLFHGQLMAESLVGMISYFNNSFDTALTKQHNSSWDRQHHRRVMMSGQKVIIVGYGEIGKLCAKKLHTMGCSITGVKRTPAKDDYAEIITINELSSALPQADHVVLILPGDDSTTGIITREHLSLMKPSAVLHNMGRGNCVKETDLIWALSNNIIRGAALDVFEEEPLSPSSHLWTMENVLITPHSTCFYEEYGILFAREVATKLPR